MKVVTPEIAWHETLPIYSCDLQPLASSSADSSRKVPNREPLAEIPLAEIEARDQKTAGAAAGKAQSDPTSEQPQTDASWTRLATAGGDNMVRLWRVHLDWTPPSAVRVTAPTGRLSRGLLQSDCVAAAATAKKSASSAAAGAAVSGTSTPAPSFCTTAAVSDGLVFLSTLRRHERLVNVVRWSPSGTYLASAGDDQFVIIWSMQPSTEPTEPRPVSNGADDADDPSSVEIWLPCRSLRRHLEDIYDLCWSPDEAFLLSGSVDHSAILWQLDLAPSSVGQEGVADQTSATTRESGSSTAPKTVILRDHKHYVQGVAWDPLGDFVATMSSDRTCRIYRAGSKNCYANICKAGKQNLFQDDSWKSFFRRPTFSPDGLLLVCPAGNLESAVFAGDVASAVSFAAAASNGGVTISSKVDEVNKTPLLLPSASPIAPQHCAHIFLRGAYARPCISLPTGPRPVVAVRFCPQAFQLRLLTLRPGVTCTSVIDLPYRLLFCLVLEDGLLFYDTQQVQPFAQVSQIHYQALNDAAWSSDARFVVTSSTDGYCSFIYFQVEELGKPYYGPLGAAPAAVATPQSKTPTAGTQRAEVGVPAAEVSVTAPEPMDTSVGGQPQDRVPNEQEKPTAPLPASETHGKCPVRKHISFENCASADLPHTSLPVTPNTGRFLSTSAATPAPAAVRAAVKTVHPPAGTKRRVPFITLCGADAVASKSSLEKADRTTTEKKPE
ncbi:Chromatin assembly factor 1 subunit B [Sparganum proliferum]